ncbi:hypothetical protein ACFSSA_10790 [Luteolibacter algae]|uniref:RHS repeat-associated core domain-containing protein n=1 Tax=Luteolibacter algae TaxID=454151 RepID=A0ABW5DBZ1_9BACT
MAYYLSEPAPGASDPTAKNRVWDFFGEPSNQRPKNRRQSLQPRRKNRPCSYKTASGIPYWPSRDPIEEAGGINLYAFVGNDGVNQWDYLGMCKDDSNGWRITDLGLEVMSLDEMNPQQPDINKASRWHFKQVKKGARDFDDTTLKWAYGVEVSLTYECCICTNGEHSWGGGDTLTDSDDTPRERSDAQSRGVELRKSLVDEISCD